MAVADGDTDLEFYESNYDAEDRDDVIFEPNVDKDVGDNNERVEIIIEEDDLGLEYEDLNLTKEQHMELKYKFGVFNLVVDMENPHFKVGTGRKNHIVLRTE